jgi:hypothetical protein
VRRKSETNTSDGDASFYTAESDAADDVRLHPPEPDRGAPSKQKDKATARKRPTARQRAMERAGRQEAERRAQRVRRWVRICTALRRRSFIASLTIVVLAAGGYIALREFQRSESEPVGGNLNRFSGIGFVEGAQRDGGISPTCGCYFPPVHEWRGVTFAGRAVTLARSGSSPYTEWIISGAEPDTVSLDGGFKRLTVEAVRLKTNESFVARWLLNSRSLGGHAKILSRTIIRSGRLNLISGNELHVSLLGSVPVGSWVPFPNSKVTLMQQPTAYQSEQRAPELTERYPVDLGARATSAATQAQRYPIGDFLGPNVVLWTEDPEAHIPGTSLRSQPGQSEITALLIRGSTFSTRIGVIPATGRDLVDNAKVNLEHASAADGNDFFGESDHGKLSVIDDQPLSESAYRAVRSQLAKNDTTTIHDFSTAYFEDEGVKTPIGAGAETERYPPLPTNAGFNVFGPMPELTFYGAQGSILAGDQTVALSAPADVRLSGVHALRELSEGESIPIPLKVNGQKAHLEFSAVSAVTVNGRDETSFLQHHASLFEGLGILIGIFGLLLTIATFIRGLQAPRRTHDH